MIDPFSTQWPKIRAQPSPKELTRAKAVRDFILLSGVALPNGFRPGTSELLDVMPDNSGHVRTRTIKDILEWLMVAGKEAFKNHPSDILKNGYFRRIPNLSNLHDYLPEYVMISRQVIVWPNRTDAFLVDRPESPRFTSDRLGAYIIRVTGRVMSADPTTYGGAKYLTFTQVRKIGTTDRFKITKDLDDARKYAMNDVPEIYTHISAHEQSIPIEEHFVETNEAYRAWKTSSTSRLLKF